MHGSVLVGILVTAWLVKIPPPCQTQVTIHYISAYLPYLHLAVYFALIYQNLYCVALTLYDYTFLIATIMEGIVLMHGTFVFESA